MEDMDSISKQLMKKIDMAIFAKRRYHYQLQSVKNLDNDESDTEVPEVVDVEAEYEAKIANQTNPVGASDHAKPGNKEINSVNQEEIIDVEAEYNAGGSSSANKRIASTAISEPRLKSKVFKKAIKDITAEIIDIESELEARIASVENGENNPTDGQRDTLSALQTQENQQRPQEHRRGPAK